MIIGICLVFFIFKNQAIKLMVRYFPIGKNCIYTDHSSHVETMVLLSMINTDHDLDIDIG